MRTILGLNCIREVQKTSTALPACPGKEAQQTECNSSHLHLYILRPTHKIL